MEPITTLTGYILSRFLHGIRIILLTAFPVVFISHESIARNIKNKAPTTEGDGGTLRGLLHYNESQSIAPGTYPLITASIDNNKSNQISQQENYVQTQAHSLPDEFTAATYTTTSKPDKGEALERASTKLQSYNILLTVQKNANASDSLMQLFCNYYYDKIYGTDRSLLWQQVESGQISSDNDIKNFAQQRINEYTTLLLQFIKIAQEYPSSVAEYAHRQTHSPMGTCNPACDNIGFESGNLSAWSAYYAQNTSSTSFTSTAPTGGACGAVSRSAYDPTTASYQVALMSGTGLDPVAGALIPVVCPTGGKYSCRIGDSTRNGAQIGILEQTFTVTPANANFTYMYAVVLENPSHPYFEQPYFNVAILDQSGNPIANCGNYSVVSGPGLPGYTAIYYAPDGDTVYCKPWTTVFVPLQAYIGQCITLKLTASDCALGGHFGYAYFDATCSPGIISSSPAICGNNVTLTAPSGAATYQWFGPCIVGSSTSQTVTVSCAGIYKVAVTSVTGSGCSDTIVDTVKGSTPPVVSIISHTNVSCNGGSNGDAVASVTGGTAPYKYSWSPSGGSAANATNLSAGTYTVTVTDATGCKDTASVIITQPAPVTLGVTAILNVSCNGGNNGDATVAAGGGTAPYKFSWSPSVSTSNSATNLAAGSYTVTVTDANSCMASISITITQPAAIVLTPASTPVSCNSGNNGTATIKATGGTGAYKYTWSPNVSSGNSASNLTAGVYTIVVTDANSCSATTTVTVNQPTPIVVSVPSHTNVTCHGSNNGSATATATGGTSPYKYAWSNGQSGTSATNLIAGTYVITVTDANGCTERDSVAITQPNALIVTSTVSNVLCNGGNDGSATASATGGTGAYTYLWNTIPPQTTPAASNLIAGNYVVTVTDANGCKGTDTAIIIQPTSVTSLISSVTNILCNGGNNGSATVTANGGTSPYTYVWTPKGGTGKTANNLTSGIYTVTVTDAHNCVTTSVATIIEPAALTITSSSTDVSCNGGNNGSITITATGGTGTYNYTWVPKVSSGNSATNLIAGNYSITVTDANGCSATANVTVTQPTALVTSITSQTNVSCNLGNNGSINTSTGGGTPPYNYAWTPKVSSGPSATNLSAGNYTLTVTDANGCTSSVKTSVGQPQPLNVVSTSVEPTCNGLENGSITAFVSGGTPAYNYVWNTAPPQYTSVATGIGAGKYVVVVTDNNGCTKNDTITLSQPAVLNTTITGAKNVTCFGDSNGSAGAAVTGGTPPYNYAWNTTPKKTTYTVSGLKVGSYTVNVTDANGCTANASVAITQPTPVTTTATAPDSVCSSTTVTITAAGSGGNGTYTYQWSTGKGSIATQNVTPDSSTTYTVTAVDGNGCKGTPATVTIGTWNLGAADLLVTPPQKVCNGDTVTLYANITNTNSGSPSITWSNGYTGSGPFMVVPYKDSTFVITAANKCGAIVTKTIIVIVNPLPVIRIPYMNGASCGEVTFNYHDTNRANSADTYVWNFGDGSTGNTNPVSVTYTQSGTYSVTVIVTSQAGCKSTASADADVTVYPVAKADFTADPKQAPITNPVITFIDESTNTSTWEWDFGDGGKANYTSSHNPVHMYHDTGRYVVTLTTNNSYGCPGMKIDTVEIVPESTFYIPNAFTPNGDGENDYFTGKGIGIVNYHMQIFDRWGMMIFETYDLYQGWDGRANGGSGIAQQDTYVYKINLTDIFHQQHYYIGAVNLLK